MATETNVNNLKIHILTQAQYNELANSGGLNENEFYSVSDSIIDVPVEDVRVGGVSVVAGKIAIIPAIPDAPGTLNTTATTAQSTSSSEALSGSITLHKIAKTGTYSDLVGKPTVDSSPTQNSSNLISSGGVYNAVSSAVFLGDVVETI